MIKIVARKGTALEQTLKEMTEQMQKNLADGIRIVEEATGVKPESIGYRWAWGNIATFRADLVRFKQEDWSKIDAKVMRRDKRDENYFKPALRYNAGRQLNQRFYDEVTSKCIDDRPLVKHGINTMFESRSVWCQPIYDEKRDRYILLASDSMPHGFNKKKMKETEFDIEYNND